MSRALAASLALLALAAGCGEGGPLPPAEFECVMEAHDWRRCTPEGVLEYCHSNYTPYPHFHEIRSCVDHGYDCVQLTQSTAGCARLEETCEDGQARCTDGDADNCLAGRWVVTSCGRRRTCAVSGAEAVCVNAL